MDFKRNALYDRYMKKIFILKKYYGDKYDLNIHKGSFFHVNEDNSDDYKKPGLD